MEAEAKKQQQLLQAEATAQSLAIIMKQLNSDEGSQKALQFLLTQQYLDTGKIIGSSNSSKVMFMNPNSILSTLQGIGSIIETDNLDLIILVVVVSKTNYTSFMITVINMESLTKLTSERFYQLCLGNPDIPMERSAQGELIIIWNSLTEEEKRQFPPICPDFVIELRSQSDRLNSPSFSFRTNSAP